MVKGVVADVAEKLGVVCKFLWEGKPHGVQCKICDVCRMAWFKQQVALSCFICNETLYTQHALLHRWCTSLLFTGYIDEGRSLFFLCHTHCMRLQLLPAMRRYTEEVKDMCHGIVKPRLPPLTYRTLDKPLHDLSPAGEPVVHIVNPCVGAKKDTLPALPSSAGDSICHLRLKPCMCILPVHIVTVSQLWTRLYNDRDILVCT